MPTSDLDMPLLPSAEQIRRREFATVRRGYDPQQVRAYLTSIANQVGTLERELSQLRLEVGSAAARTDEAVAPTPAAPASATGAEDPYDALSKRFAGLIEVADQEAERILENARSESELALEQARSEADRIRVDAQANAEEARQEGTELLEHARTESDRVLTGLAERRRGLLGQLEDMRSKLLAVAEELVVPIEDASRADVEGADIAGPVPELTRADETTDESTPVDPSSEDLLGDDAALQIPDLAAIDLEFDEGEE
ncbi:MAG: DivIVA domain-containing protein [Actinomycetota bacterium]